MKKHKQNPAINKIKLRRWMQRTGQTCVSLSKQIDMAPSSITWFRNYNCPCLPNIKAALILEKLSNGYLPIKGWLSKKDLRKL